jgi:phospholipid/cholesterol/gamma-HCH transport system substrate-binding protein
VVSGRRWTALAGLAAVLATAAALSGCSSGGVKITATFGDIGDLQSRGSVQSADVRVGSIGHISLTRNFQARVSMTLYPGVRIPRNSEALVRTTSLLGEKFVELRPLGDPAKGPFLRSGDVVTNTAQAPELEFFAQSAIDLLGAVNASSVATLVQTGAEAVQGRAPDISALIGDISQISSTLAGRTASIGRIIDGLDRATQTLAGGSDQISSLLGNLSSTTQLLAQDREQAVTALASLARLARASNYSLSKYQTAIDTQIKQLDAVTGVLANASGEVGNLLDWITKFVATAPKAVPGDFAQVYLWVIPNQLDPRSGH